MTSEKPKAQTPPLTRFVPRGKDDQLKINKTGIGKQKWGDFYVRFLSASWGWLVQNILLGYLLINLGYACVYFSIENQILNARPGSFADAFFFSIETMSTIGYGNMAPIGLLANLVVTAEVLTGFLFFAVTTGLLFAKFSQPTARVLFSDVAVICDFDGKPHLMARLANRRSNRIVNANIQLYLLRKVTTSEGHSMRKFYDLPLTRHQVPMLQLSWTLMHAIDDNSPLSGVTMETLKDWDAEIIVSLTGLDETFSQTIHSRWSYVAEDIMFDSAFADIIQRRDDNGIDVDYSRFHDYRPARRA